MTGLSLFSPAQLATIIKDTIPADVPPGTKYVVVGAVDQQGAHVVAGFTFNHGWQFRGAVEHDWTGENKAGVQVLWFGQ